MPLKNNWLLLALSVLFMMYIPSHVRLYYVVACCIYVRMSRRGQFLYFAALLFLFLYTLPSEGVQTTHTLQVHSIKDSYVIAQNQSFKCILYNVDGVAIEDVIEVEGNFERIHTLQNEGTFHFASYLQQRSIFYSMYVKSYNLVQTGSSLRAKVYTSLMQHPLHKLYQAYFYGIHENQDSFLYASGYPLQYFCILLASMLKKNKHLVSALCMLLYSIVFPSTVFVERIFVFSLISYFVPLHKIDCFGLAMCILLFYKPSMAYEVGFLIPCFLKFVFLFNVSKVPSIFLSMSSILFLQLLFFNAASAVNIVLFSLQRMLGAYYFCVLLVSIFFPFLSIILLFLSTITEMIKGIHIPFTTIVGQLHFVWIALFMYFLCRLLTNQRRKYYVYIGLLFFYQMHLKVLTMYGEVSMIDVGQGDCFLIREPFFGEVMLIDTGGNKNYDIAKHVIMEVLKSKGIHKIDKVVITHDDFDHSGALESLQEHIVIDEVIRTKQDIQLKHLHFDVFQKQHEDRNDQSLILFSYINGLRYLFLGDASTLVEGQLVEAYNTLDIDVLKVGHHGSNTSTSQRLLDTITPKIALISAGVNNSYNHPHQEVMDRLHQANVEVYNTQVDGSVSIYFMPFLNVVVTSQKEITFLWNDL